MYSVKIKVREIQAKETYAVRHPVLRPNQGIETCDYPGDHDEMTFHLGAFVDNKLVGIASFYEEAFEDFQEEKQYRLRGMATLPGYRGMQIGAQLIHAAEALLRERSTSIWWCNARKNAIGFYKKLGLAIYGEEFEIEGIGPHKVMVRK